MVWKPTVRPFKVPPATAEWGFTITREDYKNILQGFNPRDMDDKWTAAADRSLLSWRDKP
ncbi:hypothetical protein P171DRAFT_427295 [Karstenula rhodostoma CBS 690.94]|uniref:Uncharacterized protein n=1 Tax=Karstenula rhodostoma CBS 690.94 TaxID=1392251 RepID=A0A9P4UHW4_9PLEO|nr:hypothetical protein P171DRAFT_427295 [Karstenula rhodostoma CBS 690.94]